MELYYGEASTTNEYSTGSVMVISDKITNMVGAIKLQEETYLCHQRYKGYKTGNDGIIVIPIKDHTKDA